MTNFGVVWRSFTAIEKRNIALYIGGIMFYKLGLEFFNGSITALATDRFNSANTFTKLGAATGVNQAAQCVGAILIAPLVKKFPTRTVLAFAIFWFALMTAILLIVDAATGGSIKSAGATKANYGSWPANVIFFVWTAAGVAYGMVELIRRVIPADIVGGNVGKLRRMDATVHVLYEVAGTAGAFASSAAISRFGNNYSFFLTPIFFSIAGGIWLLVSALSFKQKDEHAMIIDDITGEPVTGQVNLAEVEKEKKRNFFMQILHGFYLFGESVYFGMIIVFGHRQFVWLFPAYSMALYLHRFLEGSIAPAFAKRVLLTSAWSQIFVGLSNLGELLGALAVFILSDYVTTPLPWLRLDALMLNLIWVYPYFSQIAAPNQVVWAWRVGAFNIPISFGWAAGDCSLAAFIQASLTNMKFTSHQNISALGAVMAFLYSSYIVFVAVLSPILGRVFDADFKSTGNIYRALVLAGGVQFSIGCIIILLATLIPIGALAFNPRTLGGVDLGQQLSSEFADQPEVSHSSEDGKSDQDHSIDKEAPTSNQVPPLVNN